jgi:hypothetical protein
MDGEVEASRNANAATTIHLDVGGKGACDKLAASMTRHSVASVARHSVAPVACHSVAPVARHSVASVARHSVASVARHSVAPVGRFAKRSWAAYKMTGNRPQRSLAPPASSIAHRPAPPPYLAAETRLARVRTRQKYLRLRRRLEIMLTMQTMARSRPKPTLDPRHVNCE